MSHIALYRKWRPSSFDDIVGQDHIVRTLRHSVAIGSIAHAYLFCGTRGTGKTSLAKVFAKAINCPNQNNGDPCEVCEICEAVRDGNLLDVVEIDAASNNSVDNIRRIIDEVVFLPAVAKYKVYIVDEVHMLSIGAFNALLKTLEEPPAHAVFILATTEVHRIPATITSRCQRFDFRRISIQSIVEQLRLIATQENISVDDGGLSEIAIQADGALRDALSLLDQSQMAIEGVITRAAVRNLIGVVDISFIGDLVLALIESDPTGILSAVDTLVMEGKDIIRFTTDLAQYYRNLMICKACMDPASLLTVTAEELGQLQDLAARYAQPEIVTIIKSLSKLLSDLRWITNPRTLLEVNLLSLTGTRNQPTETAQMNIVEHKPGAPPAQTRITAVPNDALNAPTTSIPDVAADDADDKVSTDKADPQTAVLPSIERVDQSPKEPPIGRSTPVAESEEPASRQLNGESPLWIRALEILMDQDALIYMFAKTAYVSGTADEIILSFAPQQKENYNILNGQRGERPLQEALREANNGKDIKLRLSCGEFDTAEDAFRQTDRTATAGTMAPGQEWATRVIDSAQTLGIKVRVDTSPTDDSTE